MKRSALWVLAMMICSTLTALAQRPTGVLTGHVLDTAGRPVIGAIIRIVGTAQGGVSKPPDGRFMVSNLVAGSYMIKITAVGYHQVETPVEIVKDSTAIVSMTLEQDSQTTKTKICICDPRALVKSERFGTTSIIAADELDGMP